MLIQAVGPLFTWQRSATGHAHFRCDLAHDDDDAAANAAADADAAGDGQLRD